MRTQYGKRAHRPVALPDARLVRLAVLSGCRAGYSGPGCLRRQFAEFEHDQDDGYDTVEWAAALPGSNGKVGMYGSSYVGATQWLAATAMPPHLTTIVPTNTASDYYDGWTYEGGEFRLAFVQPWAIGLRRRPPRTGATPPPSQR